MFIKIEKVEREKKDLHFRAQSSQKISVHDKIKNLISLHIFF